METKRVIWIGMLIGSGIGSYIPIIWGAGIFSFSSVILGAIGGIAGIYMAFRLS